MSPTLQPSSVASEAPGKPFKGNGLSGSNRQTILALQYQHQIGLQAQLPCDRSYTKPIWIWGMCSHDLCRDCPHACALPGRKGQPLIPLLKMPLKTPQSSQQFVQKAAGIRYTLQSSGKPLRYIRPAYAQPMTSTACPHGFPPLGGLHSRGPHS